MADLYVGVDGGGTHARAVVTDAAGRELARHVGPSGLVDPNDPGAAAMVVAQVARTALREAGADSAAALCCGLAGAGRFQEREAVRIALTMEHVADHVHVVGDAEAAMADAFGTGAGVLVVAGTGSIAWARAASGEPVRIGGWGQLLGDEGSGYAIGLAAMRAVVRAADRGIETRLTPIVLEHTGVAAIDGLVAWAARASKAEFGWLAPGVLRAADTGDAQAVRIRDAAVADIVELAACAAERVPGPHRIALAGGLIAPGGPLRDAVATAIGSRIPGSTIRVEPVDAALGAAALARTTAR